MVEDWSSLKPRLGERRRQDELKAAATAAAAGGAGVDVRSQPPRSTVKPASLGFVTTMRLGVTRSCRQGIAFLPPRGRAFWWRLNLVGRQLFAEQRGKKGG